MTDTATSTQQLAKSAAPGQWEGIQRELTQLGANLDAGVVADLDAKAKEFQGIEVSADVNNPLGEQVCQKLLQYHQKVYGSGDGQRRSSVSKAPKVWLQAGSSDTQFQVLSYAERIDPNNLLTGFWKSTWAVTNTSGAEAEVKGNVELHTYTYEEGNTQLQFCKTFDGVIVEERGLEEEEDPSLANGVLCQIIEWEHQVLSILKGLHELSSDNLRSIRRVLPITKTKMNWEVEAQRGVQHLKQTAKR